MLRYAVDAPPAFALPTPIADGVLWLRLPIPYRLDHVNLYLLEDAGGWTLIDAGVDDAPTREAWTAVFSALGGASAIKRIILTHHHPDHAGAAAWLQERTGADVFASEPEWRAHSDSGLVATPETSAALAAHFRWLGCAPDEAESLAREKIASWRHGGETPARPSTLAAPARIAIGGRDFRLLPGAGHSPAPLLLHDPARGLLIPGDQMLPTITPYVGAPPHAPRSSPVGAFLAFLDEIVAQVEGDPLVLPGHGLPFRGLAERAEALKAHHLARCRVILDHCRTAATPYALIEPIFKAKPRGAAAMALDEILSHVNYLIGEGALHADETDGVLSLVAREAA